MQPERSSKILLEAIIRRLFFSHKSFKKPNILVSPSILRLTNQRISKLEKFTFNSFFLTDTVVICYEGCSSPFATGAAIHRLSPLPAMTSRTLFDASKSNHKKCHTTESNVKMRDEKLRKTKELFSWQLGSIVCNRIALQYPGLHFVHEVHSPLPTLSFLAGANGGCMCDPIACELLVEKVLQQ